MKEISKKICIVEDEQSDVSGRLFLLVLIIDIPCRDGDYCGGFLYGSGRQDLQAEHCGNFER